MPLQFGKKRFYSLGRGFDLNWKAPLFLFLAINLTSCSTVQVENHRKNPEVSPPAAAVPSASESVKPKIVLKPRGILIEHKAYTLQYDPKLRSALVVRYQLTADHLRSSYLKRKDSGKFAVDPQVKARGLPVVKPNEYVKTGYDKGHLAASADFAWDTEANSESFYMSNMSPQTANLNRDAWLKLENQVRRWACGEKMITVYVGPLFGGGEKLPSGLDIPDRFFKVLVDETPPRKMLAFIYFQTDKGDVMDRRLVSVEKVSQETGIDFAAEAGFDSGLRAPSAVEGWAEADCTKGKH